MLRRDGTFLRPLCRQIQPDKGSDGTGGKIRCSEYCRRLPGLGDIEKMELKLTQVARASLEELRLDYEDFIRQRGMPQWDMKHPLRQALIDRRCRTADDVAFWVKDVSRSYGQGGSGITLSTLSTHIYPELSANAILVLIAVAGSLLDRQVERLAKDFETQGGFSERLYRVRTAKRKRLK